MEKILGHLLSPDLDEKHKYAIGLGIEGGMVAPLKSYATQEELKEGFKNFYDFACKANLTKPVPMERADTDVKWGDGKCKLLKEMFNEIANSRDPKRN